MGIMQINAIGVWIHSSCVQFKMAQYVFEIKLLDYDNFMSMDTK